MLSFLPSYVVAVVAVAAVAAMLFQMCKPVNNPARSCETLLDELVLGNEALHEFMLFAATSDTFQPTSAATRQWMPVLRDTVNLHGNVSATARATLSSAPTHVRSWYTVVLALRALATHADKNGSDVVQQMDDCILPVSRWKQQVDQNPVVEQLAQHAENVLFYVTAAVRQLMHRHTARTTHRVASRVVVVGAGPVGLLTALHAFAQGCSVRVLEKRQEYTRDTWFDVYGDPWYPSHTVLHDLGWNLGARIGRVPLVRHEGAGGVVTVQARFMEAFLSQVALTLGITIQYGSSFLCVRRGGPDFSATVLAHSSDAVPSQMHTCDNGSGGSSFACSKPWIAVDKGSDGGMCDIAVQDAVGVEVFAVPFDLLVGCDGPKSRVRHQLNMSFIHSTRFTPLGTSATTQLPVAVPQLRQVSVVINFRPVSRVCLEQCYGHIAKPGPECRCSTVEYDNTTRCPLTQGGDPWRVGFAVPGVSSVFKRFYEGKCHMQVFFEAVEGERLLEHYRRHAPTAADTSTSAHTYTHESILSGSGQIREDASSSWQTDSLPWDLLLSIVNKLLVTRVSSVEELRWLADTAPPQVQAQAQTQGEEVWDVRVVPVEIFAAQDMVAALDPQSSGCAADGLCVGAARCGGRALVALAGDARMTANYRLGVGINSAFSALTSFAQLFHTSNALVSNQAGCADALQRAAVQLNASAHALVDGFVQFQLTTMFYEAYCGFIVFFTPALQEPDVLRSQVVYRREEEGATEYVRVSQHEATACVDKWIKQSGHSD